MDAERRHELKKNDMADWVAHAPEYCKKNWFTILCVALIIIGVAMHLSKDRGPNRDVKKYAAINEQYAELSKTKTAVLRQQEDASALLQVADNLVAVADAAPSKFTKAVVLIEAADAIRSELHLRPVMVEAEEVQTQIKSALELYERALVAAENAPTAAAMAELGIAICSEELSQFDQAAQQYKKIADNEAYATTIAALVAKNRLERLADSKVEFTFVEAPVEEPVAETPAVETPEQPAADQPVQEN